MKLEKPLFQSALPHQDAVVPSRISTAGNNNIERNTYIHNHPPFLKKQSSNNLSGHNRQSDGEKPRTHIIKVDLESSKHKNLKKTQHVNRVKDIYHKEIQYVIRI